jgi:hypothetical protein
MRGGSGAGAIARAVTDSVDAARASELAAFDEATERLAVLDPEQLTLVQAAVIRALLEENHPGGLSGEDVAEVLERCVRSAAGWLSALDPTLLVTVLTGALGVFDPDEEQRSVDRLGLATHASLVIADLLVAGDLQLPGYVDLALAEIQRAETIEMP